MRLLAKVTIPLENGDAASKSGAFPRTMQSAMERLKPEASYFFEQDGKRECLFVFNLDMQSLLQPLFPGLDAAFEVTPVMNAAEFGLEFGNAKGGQPSVANLEFFADIRPGAKHTSGSQPIHGTWVESEPLRTTPDDERAKAT